MQLIIGTIMFVMSFYAENLLRNVRGSLASISRNSDRHIQPTDDIYLLSAAFTGLVFFSATQGS